MLKNISYFFKELNVQAFVFLIGCALLVGCATSPDAAAKKLSSGMLKTDVIEIMGNPDHADRVHNMDRWTYDANNGRTKPMEVYFTDGKVSFFGVQGELSGTPRTVSDPKKGSFKEVPAEKGFKPLPVEKNPESTETGKKPQ